MNSDYLINPPLLGQGEELALGQKIAQMVRPKGGKAHVIKYYQACLTQAANNI